MRGGAAWLLLLWELPQTILGAALYLLCRASGGILAEERYGRRLVFRTRRMGVSLGYFVFWFALPAAGGKEADESIRSHELGHALQSSWLGPLYLIAVGLPSVIRAGCASLYAARHRRPWSGYFRAYPERWADRLGGVRTP